MSKLRVAVVGVGSLGQHHARIAAASDATELVAVVDPAEPRGREIAGKFGTAWVPELGRGAGPGGRGAGRRPHRASTTPWAWRCWRPAST